jgi:hypothetical protein
MSDAVIGYVFTILGALLVLASFILMAQMIWRLPS